MIAKAGLRCPGCGRDIGPLYRSDGSLSPSQYLGENGFICDPQVDGCGQWWVVLDNSLIPATEHDVAMLSLEERKRLAMIIQGDPRAYIRREISQ